MPDSPPRLETAPASQPSYAPVSWTAVACVLVSGFFVILLLVLGVFAALKKQPLIDPPLLVFPAVGVVLAFTARRQIENSEGTRTGLGLASAGWWMSVLAGSGYVAYLFAIDYAIRNDAERELHAWTTTVTEIDPANPKDEKLYEAVYKTVPARSRAQVKNAKDIATADRVFREELARLRQLDVVRIAGRNRGDVKFTSFGVKDWQQSPTRISCVLTCKMLTPEGEYHLAVPMQASVERTGRQWQVVAAGDGLVQMIESPLTRYGWLVQQVEQSGKEFADMFLRPASFPGQQLQLFQMFVRTSAIDKTGQSAAVAGLPAIVACDLTEYEKAVNGPFFTLPGGAEPTAEDRARFKQYWEQGRLRRAGNVLHESPDTNPILRIADGAVELRVPVEIALSGSGSSAEAARGKLLLRATDPGLLAELAAAKAAKGEATQQPPKDLTLKPVEWRVVRIESDLKAIASGPPPQQGGGGPDAGAGFGD